VAVPADAPPSTDAPAIPGPLLGRAWGIGGSPDAGDAGAGDGVHDHDRSERTRSTEELHVSTEMSRQQRESPWASGLTLFAAALLVIGGVWHVFAGIAALVHDKVYLSTPEYLYSFDLTGWGWIQLLLGILAGVAGWAILKGQTWARIVGIGFALLSMAIQFLIIPLYPIWSVLMIALDIAIIFALATYRRDAL
jgi:hypothetical protein